MVKLMRKIERNFLPLISPKEPERHAVHDRLKVAGKDLKDLLIKS